jgi:hypothetical protein
MKEYPILFSASMVKAILDGTKTQTRRVIKPRGVSDDVAQWLHAMAKGVDMPCPYGKPGDVLWVREAWDFRHWGEPGNPFRVMVSYGADGFQKLCQSPHDWNPMIYSQPRWRPSIHMPRWACRIELEIISVRAERVQEITRNDAKAEGVSNLWKNPPEKEEHYKRVLLNPYVANYSVLWDEINAGRGFGWNVNPFVWVIEFQRRGITPLAPDAGESAPLQALSTPEHSATSQNLSTPTQRG